MFLFILESIGTSELILIGIVALIFLGPRKLPEIARKIGKITSEFRGTASEFKQTWEREVDFEEEAKALDLNKIESEAIAREPQTGTVNSPADAPAAPEIKQMDPADFQHMIPPDAAPEVENVESPDTANDKKHWL